MKTQHTPGPWNVSECGSIEFADGFLGEAYDFNGTTKTDLPMMANARLMAAAPELLEFVEGVAEGLKTGGNPGYLEDAVAFLEERAQHIIAKFESDE